MIRKYCETKYAYCFSLSKSYLQKTIKKKKIFENNEAKVSHKTYILKHTFKLRNERDTNKYRFM